ncbi:heat shock protein [Trifolium pratense]|uniref:Heat shock protein n=1 Tax=Trifolium pratense TaxID=57577 RepID=A0A2K3M2C9_TRIPR|nr:heat shock protein [Trifolium pratense]
MRFISEFHRNGRLTKGLNATFIALIPKVDSPQSVISESQTPFVKGLQILDGIVIANEVMDEARRSKKELFLFKRKWIKECVCTATTSVLVNGSPTDEFPLRQLREFNFALLGKWCWRMLVGCEGLRGGGSWLVYGIVEVSHGEGGLESTFREMWGMDLILSSGLIPGWMGLCCRRGLGGCLIWPKTNRLQWLRCLCGGGVLEGRHECGGDHVSDRWQWQPNLDGGYTVRGAYQLLMTHDAVTLDAAAGLIWHPQVPLKVSFFVLRLLRDRLPTKANLVIRGILSSEHHHCVSGCGDSDEVESAQHLFLSCSTFGALWSLVSSWIGSSLVTAQTPSNHFIQFTASAGGLRARHSFMQLIWLACVWVVWTERNHRLFSGSTNSLHFMLDKIKTFSYKWLKATSSTLALNCHNWWYSHMLCLSLV